MADTLELRYVFGPCNQRVEYADRSLLAGGALECGGATYIVTHIGPTGAVLTYAKDAERIAASQAAYGSAQLGAAWSRLMRTLSHTGPQKLREIQHAGARIRRAVR